MNLITEEKGIHILIQQLEEERLIPIFGAGFSKGAKARNGIVPDGWEASKMMQKIILQCVDFIAEQNLSAKTFNDTAKLFNQLNNKGFLKGRYKDFFRDNFTDAHLDNIKKAFLEIAWPYALTLNVDDAIEKTGAFTAILPYLNADNNYRRNKSIYKLHGDASFECLYLHDEATIVFDMDQYTKSLNDVHNQSFRDCICNTYRDFNMFFIGCSLTNEADLKYLYNQTKEEAKETSRFILRKEKPDLLEEMTLEEHGITDIILTEDYDRFYVNFLNEYQAHKIKTKIEDYPFKNPTIKAEPDKDLKYFGGYRTFDEKENCFHKSNLIIERDCIDTLHRHLERYNMLALVGRRFSGKTAILSMLCEKEIRRNVYFFPSTTSEGADVIQNLLNHTENALFVFDTNSLSPESYFLIRDSECVLKEKQNKVIIAVNQSDNYLTEEIDCEEIPIKNVFSEKELKLFKEEADSFGFAKRTAHSTNLDYLEQLHTEQKLTALKALQLPKNYTENEKILMLLLGVKDKVYTNDILTLGIPWSELKRFLERTATLTELIKNSKGENSANKSTRKLVHNSKMILLKEIQNFQSQDTLKAIIRIVTCFLKGSYEQKRIYKEVMQFDTLNQLFGRKNGAGKLISRVYEELQPILKNDLHYWLQRAKSIYWLVPDNNYNKLKESYGYAKKVYLDSNQKSLSAKAALTTSLICCLLYRLEQNPQERLEYQSEAIRLGYEAIQSEYYRSETRLNSEINSGRYRSRLLETCRDFTQANSNRDLNYKALELIRKYGNS